jgi:hypothetical protein
VKLSYEHLVHYQFPHWIEHATGLSLDSPEAVMDINEWVGKQCGELGTSWGFERRSDSSSAPPGLNPVKVRLYHTTIIYSWRFKNKEDAMLFKLTWGGA